DEGDALDGVDLLHLRPALVLEYAHEGVDRVALLGLGGRAVDAVDDVEVVDDDRGRARGDVQGALRRRLRVGMHPDVLAWDGGLLTLHLCQLLGQFSHARTSPQPARSTRSRSRVRTLDRKSTRLNSSHVKTSYAVFCLKKSTVL